MDLQISDEKKTRKNRNKKIKKIVFAEFFQNLVFSVSWEKTIKYFKRHFIKTMFQKISEKYFQKVHAFRNKTESLQTASLENQKVCKVQFGKSDSLQIASSKNQKICKLQFRKIRQFTNCKFGNLESLQIASSEIQKVYKMQFRKIRQFANCKFEKSESLQSASAETGNLQFINLRI